MALVNREAQPGDSNVALADTRHCYYCGGPLDAFFIEWRGHRSGSKVLHVIPLHPACTVDLCVRLLRDVHEYECLYGTEVTLTDK